MFLLKNIDITFGEAALFSLVAILIVFVILCIIIAAVWGCSKINFAKFEKKPAAKPVAKTAQASAKKLTIEDIKDDDMMVAALVATAEFVEETKEKDARLVSIKQIG